MDCSSIRRRALRSWSLAILCLALTGSHNVAAAHTLDHVGTAAAAAGSAEHVLPNVTHSGFLPVDAARGSSMFYTYHEAQQGSGSDVPIILWLEARPLCPILGLS